MLALLQGFPSTALADLSATRTASPAAVEEGGTVTYTTTIKNNGVAAAANVQLVDPDVANTTLVAGSLQTTAVALNDSYSALGNVSITIAAAQGLLVNDLDPDNVGPALVATAETNKTTTQGGKVTILTDGGFTYQPPAGYEGGDTFTYTLDDGEGNTDTATVTITVSGMIWFIDNTAAAGGDGTLAKPFNTLAAFKAINDGTGNHPANNDSIFIYESATDYLGGINLRTGQKLVGQDATSGLLAITGLTAPAGSAALPSMNSGNTTYVSIVNGSGDAILLGNDSRVEGLRVGSPTNATSGSGIKGTSLTNATIASSVSISNVTGNDFELSGNGNGTVNFGASITNTAGRAVTIQNRTGGVVNLTAAISDSGSGTGILLNTNTGATINFTGGMALSLAATKAFTATGGGTINVTQDNTSIVNTITNGAATALEISGVTIGSSGVTFRSVSSNGGPNGIFLSNTGTSGSFTIAGNGTAASGGTIQNTTGDGILLATTKSPSFTRMSISGTGGSGVAGTGVDGFTFTNGSVTNAGNAAWESAIAFNNGSSGSQGSGSNLTGVLTVTNCTFTNSYDSAIDVQSDNGTVTDAIITGNTINGTTAGNGVNFVGKGTGSTVFKLTKALIATNTLSNIGGAGIQILTGNADVSGPGAVAGTPLGSDVVSVTTNTISLKSSATNAIIVASQSVGGNRSQTNFDISNNPAIGSSAIGTVILIGNNGNSTMQGIVRNNVITATHTAGLGGGNGIGGGNGAGSAAASSTPSLTLTVEGNAISGTDGSGILLVGRGATGSAKLKIKSNNVGAPVNAGGTARQGIRVEAGNASSVNDAVYLNIESNTSAGSNGGGGIGIRKQGTLADTNLFAFYDPSSTLANPATGPQAQAFVAGRNPAGGTVDIVSGSNFRRDTGNLAPPLLLGAGGVEAAAPAATVNEDAVASGAPVAEAAMGSVPSAPVAAPVIVVSSREIDQAGLDATVRAALIRWEASGLTAEQVQRLKSLEFVVADLGSRHLGEAAGRVIRVDRDAGGHGWFSSGSGEDDLFPKVHASTRFETETTAAPAGRIDLLTTLLHEMGHALGLEDSYLGKDRDSIMYGFLAPGERRVPAMGQAEGAVPHEHEDMHFLSAPLVIGTLPPGKTIVVTYQVVVDDPVAAGVTKLTSQASVTANSLPTVLTDDPAKPGATDPTETPLLLPPVITNGPLPSPATAGTVYPTFTYTFTGQPAPTFSVSTGALPGGLSISPAGAVSGTPTAGGVFTGTIKATNAVSPDATQAFEIVVNQAPAFTSTNSTAFTVGASGSFSFTTSGYPISAGAMDLTATGDLPAGVTFTDNGDGTATLSGNPEAGEGGTYVLSVGAANGIGTAASQTFTLTVNEAPSILSANTTTFTATSPGSFQLTTRGFPVPSITQGGTRPGGVNFTDNGNGTAALSGTPAQTSAGTYPLTFTASNGIGTDAVQNFSLVVKPPVDHFVVSAPSNATAGTPFNVTVTAYDEDSAVVTGYTGTIAFSSTSAGTLPANSTLTNGTGTFSVTLTAAGSQTVSVGDIVIVAAQGTSGGITVAAGADAKLAFAQQPTDAVSAAAIAPAPSVRILDAYDNPTTSTASVTVAIGTNPNTGTLSGTKTVAAVAGVATFNGLSIDKAGTGYTLTAASGSMTGATSSAFAITAGAPAKLAFTAQPSTTVSSAAISPAIVVQVQDLAGNPTTAAVPVTLAIGTNPGGGTPGGTLTVTSSSGLATFTGISINKAGTGYTLSAASPSLTGTTSSTFDIIAGAPNKLAFSVNPATSAAGASLATSPKVSILDADGNVTTSTANVTVALGANPGSGTLSGTKTVAAVAGVATFSDLSIDKTGIGYTLAATSGVLTGATSGTFDITPAAASKLAFGVAPSTTVAGASIAPAVTVRVLDAFDNLTTSTASVTVALGANPGSGTLSGTKTVAAVAGVATFSDLSIDKTGTGYTLAASSGVLTGATSSTFNITPAAASKLAFGVAPTNTVAGVPVAPAVTVRLLDAFDNLTTSTANVTVALGANPGSGTLSGTTTQAAVAGVATFGNLSINKVGSGYTLAASSGVLTGATSSTFDITPAAASKLAFGVAPTNAVAGVPVAPAVTVRLLDAFDNLTTSTANVTVALGANPGSGTLSGTTTQAAVAGVATFGNLSINKVGSGYTLAASSGVLTGATSSTFDITPAAASKLAFGVAPTNAVAGVPVAPAVTVRLLDAFDNLTTSTANVTVALGANPGGGTLSGTTTQAAVAGVATFGNLSINKVGSGYTLAATSGVLTGATSSTFNITPAAAAKLAFVQIPVSAVAGEAFTAQVRTLDAFDNETPGTPDITVALASNPGSGTLSGTLTQTAAVGVATFGNLSINKVGTGYTLTASSGALTAATSGGFNITPAATHHFAVSAPSTAIAGTAFNFSVTAKDAFDNTTPAFAGTVTFSSSDGGAVLPVASPLTNGLGTFSVTLKAGGDQTVTATSGLITGTSGIIAVTPRADLAVTNSGSPDPVLAGNLLTYTIGLTNQGPSAAGTVQISDPVPAGTTLVSFNADPGWTTNPGSGPNPTVSASKTSVAANETATFTLVVRVNSNVPHGTVLSNTATVTSSTEDIVPGNNSMNATNTVGTQSDLSLVMTDSPDPVVAGTELTYSLTLTNAGPSDAQTVTISDTLPAGTTFVSATAPAGWTPATPAVDGTGTVTFSGTTLAASANPSFQIKVKVASNVAAGAVISNTATASSATTDPTPGNNSATATTTVSRQSDLAVTVSDSVDPVNATTNLAYTITVTNLGASDAATVEISDPLPGNTTFVSVASPSGWTPETPAVGGTGTVKFKAASLAAGDSATFTVTVNVNANAPNDSTLVNTVTAISASTDPNAGNSSASESTLVKSGADLTILVGAAPEPVIAGTELTYTLEAGNLGPLDADNVEIVDTLPAGTTFLQAIAPAGWIVEGPAVGANGVVKFKKTLFAFEATATFTIVTKVESSVATGAVLTNPVSIASTTLDIGPGNNTHQALSTVETRSDLALSISGAPNPAIATSNVTYTLTLTNSGPSDAAGVTVTDVLPSAMTFVSASAPGGWSASTPAVGNGGTVIFSRASFANGGSATFTIVAKVKSGTANGTVIDNSAAVATTGTDPNGANNGGLASIAVGTVNPTPLQIGTTGTLNKQTGLFELSVDVTNTTPYPINGFRLHVDFNAYKAAHPSLRLYNATSAPGAPDTYVDYAYPVPVDGKVSVKLLFYTSTRQFPSPFAPVLTVEKLQSSQVPGSDGSGVQPRIVVRPDRTVLLEFPSVTGHWYRVRYSADLVNWYDCPVPIQAGGSRTQWIDNGAPFTNISPADPSVTSRFYRVNEVVAP